MSDYVANRLISPFMSGGTRAEIRPRQKHPRAELVRPRGEQAGRGVSHGPFGIIKGAAGRRREPAVRSGPKRDRLGVRLYRAAASAGIMRSRTRYYRTVPGNRTGRPVTASCGAVVTSTPAGRSGSACGARRACCVDPWRSAGRLGVRGARPCGRDVPRPVRRGTVACCRGHCAPALRRRSVWLDQASATRVLGVPPRGRRDGSAIAATSSQCFPGPPVRSRRRPSAAA
jgi:hypothetical protein